MRRWLVWLAVAVASTAAMAQGEGRDSLCLGRDDLAALKALRTECPTPRRVTYGFGRRSLNPFYHMAAAAMYAYQRSVSPIMTTRCAFRPTCSAYGKGLIADYGLVRGVVYTADRLTRCNRISLSDRHYKALAATAHGKGLPEGTERYGR